MDIKVVHPSYALKQIRRNVDTVTQKVIVKTFVEKNILTDHHLNGIKMAPAN